MMAKDENLLREDENQVPVFLIPLAKALALAEAERDSSLTEEEVLKIRDEAPCIMLPKEKVKAFKEAQEFKDIDPLNVWSEWNRVKYEYFGAGKLPTFIFSILCNREQVSRIRTSLKNANLNCEVLPPNQKLAGDVINARSKLAPAMDNQHREKILRHGAVLQVKSEAFKSDNAAETSSRILQSFPSLIDAGAIEIFCDSSYICHANSVWRSLATDTKVENIDSNQAVFWQSILLALVQHPIRFEDDFISCGMHLLGKPDFLIHSSTLMKVFGVSDVDAGADNTARELMHKLAIYLLISCTDGSFISGNTFSLAADAPSLRAIWQPCDVFPMDDPRFNYLGYWRLDEVS